MFKILEFTKDNLIAFQVEGKVKKSDYDKLKPLLNNTKREQEKQKLYIEIKDLEGIEPAALWEDFKLFFKHIRNFDKIAIVASGEVSKTLSKLTKPFISGEVRYFDYSEAITARNWVIDNETN